MNSLTSQFKNHFILIIKILISSDFKSLSSNIFISPYNPFKLHIIQMEDLLRAIELAD